MMKNPAVLYSFCLYVLYVLLPLVPAILIFRLFPDTRVSVSGPLQNLTVNATGAFAAYVVTAALAFFLVKDVERQIQFLTHYAVEGVIVDLDNNQYISSDRFYSRWTTVDAKSNLPSYDYYFVVLLDHPPTGSETVWVQYGDYNNVSSGVGPPPAPKQRIPLELADSISSPQRFRLVLHNNQPKFEREPEAITRIVPSMTSIVPREGGR